MIVGKHYCHLSPHTHFLPPPFSWNKALFLLEGSAAHSSLATTGKEKNFPKGNILNTH